MDYPGVRFKKREKRAEFLLPLFQESDMTVFFSKLEMNRLSGIVGMNRTRSMSGEKAMVRTNFKGVFCNL